MHTIAPQYSPVAQLRGLLRLMCPKQWIKNGFVLTPLVFTGEFLNLTWVSAAVIAALLFCIASSATYIVNDMCDIEHDRRHPKKSKTRPLAAGIVTMPMAIGLLGVLYGALMLGGSSHPM